MALIKTALELALERTREVEADPSLVEAHEAKQSGKKSVGDFLDILPEEDSADTAMAAAQTRFIKDLPPPVDKSPRSRAFREGALEALLAETGGDEQSPPWGQVPCRQRQEPGTSRPNPTADLVGAWREEILE